MHNEFSVLIDSLFYASDLDYPQALGYQGVNMNDPVSTALIQQGKLVQVDQTDCLFSHTAMQNPSKAVFEKIYKEAIWKKTTDFHFGGYTRP